MKNNPGKCMIIKQKVDKYESIKNGERSVGKTLRHFNKDQLWRYVRALDFIAKTDTVLDYGCGVGFGSHILSHKAQYVTGIDRNNKVIEFANQYYKTSNMSFICKENLNISGKYDVLVACEIIEHIKDTEKLFEEIKKMNFKRIILSVPHISAPNNNPFHFKHFSEVAIKEHLQNIDYKIKEITTPYFSGGYAVYCVAERKEINVRL